MDLADAIRSLIPLQLLIPNPRKPLQLKAHCAADTFLVETTQGAAVVWVEAFWCKEPSERVARIAYARPRHDGFRERWVDHDPGYGPHCLAYQRPFIIERLTRESPVWRDYKAWQYWRASQGHCCGRRAAWQRIEQELGDGIVRRTT
ncbi:hypothetical protein [Halochromatium sp.]